MIALEIVTLVGALVTVMIAISQIQSNALHRAKLEHGLDTLDLAKKLNCDAGSFESHVKGKLQSLCAEQQSSLSTVTFIWRILVGVVVLTGFSCLSANLFKDGLTIWGVIAAIFAIIGLIMLIAAWTAKKQLAAFVEQINHSIACFAPTPTAAPAPSAKAPEVPAEPVAAAELQPACETKAEPAAAPCTYKQRVPTDSILKRHFISHIRCEIEAGMYPSPTDSILKRHYEHLLETRLSEHLAQMQA